MGGSPPRKPAVLLSEKGGRQTLVNAGQFRNSDGFSETAFVDGSGDADQTSVTILVRALPFHAQSSGTPCPNGEKIPDLVIAPILVHCV
jgi:hypothetical protein